MLQTTPVIENCLIYNNTGTAIKTSVTVENLKVSNCTIYGNSKGLNLVGNGTLKDCIITNNTTGVSSGSSHFITYSDIWNNLTDFSGGISAGTGCINLDPVFVNPGTDFHLQPTSPCIGTDSQGNDMGYHF